MALSQESPTQELNALGGQPIHADMDFSTATPCVVAWLFLVPEWSGEILATGYMDILIHKLQFMSEHDECLIHIGFLEES